MICCASPWRMKIIKMPFALRIRSRGSARACILHSSMNPAAVCVICSAQGLEAGDRRPCHPGGGGLAESRGRDPSVGCGDLAEMGVRGQWKREGCVGWGTVGWDQPFFMDRKNEESLVMSAGLSFICIMCFSVMCCRSLSRTTVLCSHWTRRPCSGHIVLHRTA